MADISVQLSEQKRLVDFKTYDFSVKELVSMINDGIIDISPEYQRKFRWDDGRQSMLIESIFLGIPVPSLFMATNGDATWEVIDGLQRLGSIVRFVADIDSLARKKVGKNDFLRLKGLGKLTEMNGKTIEDISTALKLDFLLKPIKVITLSDKSDFQVRFDLFERLNTGGITLTDQEIRNCVYKGSFNDFIKRLSKDNRLRRLTMKPKSASEDGTYEELVLRFFAYLYGRDLFEHNVKDFLNRFMSEASNYDEKEYEAIFDRVFDELSGLPYGIVKNKKRKTTSIVFWEAVTVGAAETLMYEQQQHLNLDGFYDWANTPEFNKLITGATNSRPMIDNRIKYTREKFAVSHV
ncbi:MAG: DUF262 domain-containing protein [Bacteroidaceae bacterium]|nr:DUF262 domain-containing protein [Bacteroidaceae bacterium]